LALTRWVTAPRKRGKGGRESSDGARRTGRHGKATLHASLTPGEGGGGGASFEKRNPLYYEERTRRGGKRQYHYLGKKRQGIEQKRKRRHTVSFHLLEGEGGGATELGWQPAP